MSDSDSPGRRLRTGFARATLAAIFTLAALAGVGGWLALRPPSWWAPSAPDSIRADRGAAFEQALVSEFTRVRPAGSEWAIRIQASDVNDWLVARLPQWLSSRDLPQLGPAQVCLLPGVIRVGTLRGPAVVWSAAEPRALGGGVQLTAPAWGVGRLRLPWPGTDAMELVGWGQEKPIPLPDGRKVRILDLEVLDGEIRLRLRTEPG
ncbi:MAG: hypothetical protein EBQ99_00930 [Planctomycetes bacterium]|nr:hypothetical protein [Planctomycetota bacterium]